MKMDFTATYLEFVSTRSFAEVVSAFERSTGETWGREDVKKSILKFAANSTFKKTL
jgi:hypothetical protein